MPGEQTPGEKQALPDSWVQKYVQLGRDATFFGKPMANLTKDELLAIIGYLGFKEQRTREDHLRQIDLLKEFGRAVAASNSGEKPVET
jgi:hypothetical protein